MKKMLDTTEQLFSHEKVDQIAKDLKSNCEDGWDYVPCHGTEGSSYAYINIYDEDGEFIAKY